MSILLQAGVWMFVLNVVTFCQASHYAYGTINWKRREGGEPWEYTVRVEMGMRIGYFGWSMPAVDEYFDDDTFARFSIGYQPESCAAPDCGSACTTEKRRCDNYRCITEVEEPPHQCIHDGGEQLTFYDFDFHNEVKVDKLYESNDYWIGHHERNITIPDLTINNWVARESRWQFYFYGFARVETLNGVSMIDGNGYPNSVSMQLDTVLDPAFEASPICFGLPREYAAVGVLWTFDFSQQVSHPNNLVMTYSLAPGVPEGGWGDGNYNTFPNSGLLNSLMGSMTDDNPVDLDTHDFLNTGVMTWTPTQTGFYAMQVWVTDSNGNFSPMDFIIEVIEVCT